MEDIETCKQLEEEALKNISRELRQQGTENIKTIPPQTYIIKGFRTSTHMPRVVLEDSEGKVYIVWSNTKLTKILNVIKKFFNEEDKNGQTTFYFVPKGKRQHDNLKVVLEPQKSFYSNGREIKFIPISVNTPAYTGPQERLTEIERETIEIKEESKTIFLECVDAPHTNKTKPCKDVDPGSYKILRFSKTEFRKKVKTYSHLIPID